MRLINLSGQRYGRWTVLKKGKAEPGNTFWLARCDCGQEREVPSKNLRSGKSQSCGCLRHELLLQPRRDPVDVVINAMFVTMKNCAKHRGIAWKLDKSTFRNLVLSDCHYCGIEPTQIRRVHKLSLRYNGIDRVDSDGPYSTENCVTSCGVCNKAKSTMTIAEFEVWLRRVVRHFQSRDL